MDTNKIDRISKEVCAELTRATNKFGAFNSAHEGYAIILEEVDELWDEVKSNGPERRLRAEAIQIAAMAMRFVYDICEPFGVCPKCEIPYDNAHTLLNTKYCKACHLMDQQ